MFLAAAIQMTAGPDREANEERALALLSQACDREARLVGLPEVWEHVGPAAQKRGFAGPLEGPQLAKIRELAAKRGVFVVAGSISERGADPSRIYNTTTLIDPSGAIAAVYRKLHLFDVDIPDGAQYRESATVAPGTALPPVAELTGLGLRIGLSVCYDLRFPELYRKMADQGADILSVPAAFTAYTGRAHWEVLLRARAIENQAFAFADVLQSQRHVHSERYQRGRIVLNVSFLLVHHLDGTKYISLLVAHRHAKDIARLKTCGPIDCAG